MADPTKPCLEIVADTVRPGGTCPPASIRGEGEQREIQ